MLELMPEFANVSALDFGTWTFGMSLSESVLVAAIALGRIIELVNTPVFSIGSFSLSDRLV